MDEIHNKPLDAAKPNEIGEQSAVPHVNNGAAKEGVADEEETDYIPDDGENSVDDEATLEEEEALENDGDIAGEVAALQEDQDISVDELIRLYGYENSVGYSAQPAARDVQDQANSDVLSPSSSSSTCNQDSTSLSKSQDIGYVSAKKQAVPTPMEMDDEDAPSREHGYFSTSDEDSETDFDYVPDESWRKEIKIGSEYQADIPNSTISDLNETGPADNLDECVWCPDPLRLSDEAVEKYLRSGYRRKRAIQSNQKMDANKFAMDGPDSGNLSLAASRKRKSEPPVLDAEDLSQLSLYLRDDETALKLLFECHYNVDVALAAWATVLTEQLEQGKCEERSWREDDQTAFEEGLKAHGKNFRLIQQEFLPDRKVSELVHYYYLWKRTERHDVFVQNFRFEKRHFVLHPSATDYMDHFLDHMAVVGASSMSPSQQGGNHGDHSLLYHGYSHHPYSSLLGSAATSRLHHVSALNSNQEGDVASGESKAASGDEGAHGEVSHSQRSYAV